MTKNKVDEDEYKRKVKGEVNQEEQAKRLEKINTSLNSKLNLIMKYDRIYDDTLEKILTRQDLNAVLDDIASVFKNNTEFVHSEINVFAHDVGDMSDEDYHSFKCHSIDEIIDSSVSSFDPDTLKFLEDEIKKSAFMVVREGFVYVEDTDNKDSLRQVFSPIYSSLSVKEVEKDLRDKIKKAKKLGIKAHVSVLLSSNKSQDGKDVKVPLGYFHLTKRSQFSDDERYLITRMSKLSAVAIDNYFNMKKKEEAVKQLEAKIKDDDIRTAKVIKSLIPDELIDTDGFSFAHFYKPADVIGGDAYDVLDLGDHLAYLVIDVVGHGIPAAIQASNAKGAFVTRIKNTDFSSSKVELSDIMKDVSYDMCDIYPGETANFLTAVIAILDKRTKEFSYCTAGHELTLVYRSDSMSFEKLNDSEGPLMLFSKKIKKEGFKWNTGYATLRKGDYLLLLTDGLGDCRNDKKEFFKNHMIKTEGKHFKSPSDMLNYFLDMRERFPIDKDKDDVTVVITYVGK